MKRWVCSSCLYWSKGEEDEDEDDEEDESDDDGGGGVASCIDSAMSLSV